MQQWIAFWKIVCLVGFAGFYLSVLVIVPLGIRDIIVLLRRLRAEQDATDHERTE